MILTALFKPLHSPVALLALPLLIIMDASSLPSDRSDGAALGFGPRYTSAYCPPHFRFIIEADDTVRLCREGERSHRTGTFRPLPRQDRFLWDVTHDTYETGLCLNDYPDAITPQQRAQLTLLVADRFERERRITPRYARWMREGVTEACICYPRAYVHNTFAAALFGALAYAVLWQLATGFAKSAEATAAARKAWMAAQGLCTNCEHNLSGVLALRCPKCGTPKG